MRILIIDDEKSVRESLEDILKDEGYPVISASTGREGILKAVETQPDVILLDLFLPGMSGIEVLKKLSEEKITELSTIIVISGHGTIETAVKAIKLGAFDFIEKPINLERLLSTIEKAKRQLQLIKTRNILFESRESLIGESPAMKNLKETIEIVSKVDSTVLIIGESGTGKELVARSIHRLSKRADKPFVDINCAAIPDNLIESELFGYEKGAFTGATKGKKGKFEIADEGTLFLDEIGDMPMLAQSKLLRVLEERKISRIGSVDNIPVDVRVIAATNKNLEEEVKRGNFREDLFYRINVVPIYVPPLRERGEDIIILAEHFLSAFSKDYKREKPELSDDVKEIMLGYSWPGNVRELKNLMERLTILTHGKTIKPSDLPKNMFEGNSSLKKFTNMQLKQAKEEFEKNYIKEIIEKFNGDLKKAAKFMGIDISNLYRKLNKYGINSGTV
jgi:two-component system nitrogen regulation response regulator NtrX